MLNHSAHTPPPGGHVLQPRSHVILTHERWLFPFLAQWVARRQVEVGLDGWGKKQQMRVTALIAPITLIAVIDELLGDQSKGLMLREVSSSKYARRLPLGGSHFVKLRSFWPTFIRTKTACFCPSNVSCGSPLQTPTAKFAEVSRRVQHTLHVRV